MKNNINWQKVETHKDQKITFSKQKLVLPLGIALAGTLLQFAFISQLGTAKEQGGQANIPTKKVIVAKVDIPKGGRLTRENVMALDVPANLATKGFIPASEFSQVHGRRVLIDVPAQTPVMQQALMSQLQVLSLPERIPVGKRLYVLKADLGDVGGVLKTGDRIDVVGNLNLPEKGMVTVKLLSNIPVVAVGDNMDADISAAHGSGTSNIALHLTPKEIDFLTHAKLYGNFSIVLRNPNDNSDEESDSIMTNTYFMSDKRIQGVYKNDLFQIKKGTE